jgi:hypothetical protein
VGFCAAREIFLAPVGNGTKFFGRPGRRFINIPAYNIPAPKPLLIRVENRRNSAKMYSSKTNTMRRYTMVFITINASYRYRE